MAFRIGDNSVSKQLTLEQLTKGLDPQKDKKKIDRITQIFNQYNTNKTGSSENSLDIDEQIALMNDLHKADGDGKGEKFDGKISGRGLKKAGLEGEYKAYRDFLEAYQQAVADDVNTYDLTFIDKTAGGQAYIETSAVQEGSTSRTEYKYNDLSGTTARQSTTQSNEGGSWSVDPQGRLIRQVIDDTSIQYKYTGYEKNAKPVIITIRQEGADDTQMLKLQDDNTYFDEINNTHYRLNRDAIPEPFTIDDKNRITSEMWNKNQFDYTYEGENTTPATITVNQGADDQKVYTQNGELYTSPNGEATEYFRFDPQKRTFTPTEAPEPPKPAVEKEVRPTTRKLIRMTDGWKNQKVKPDAATIEQFNNMSLASEVLAELVARNDNFKDKNIDTEALTRDLIANNPSVFNKDGVIYSNANWNRLDFPKDLSRYVLPE